MTEAEKECVARTLDARVRTFRLAGLDDVALFAAMAEHMPALKRLMDTAAPGELDRLAGRFPDLHHYAVLLTSIAAGIRDGAIDVPR